MGSIVPIHSSAVFWLYYNAAPMLLTVYVKGTWHPPTFSSSWYKWLCNLTGAFFAMYNWIVLVDMEQRSSTSWKCVIGVFIFTLFFLIHWISIRLLQWISFFWIKMWFEKSWLIFEHWLNHDRALQQPKDQFDVPKPIDNIKIKWDVNIRKKERKTLMLVSICKLLLYPWLSYTYKESR